MFELRPFEAAAALATPVISETEPNDSITSALVVNRNAFVPTEDGLSSVTVEGNVSAWEDEDYFGVSLAEGEYLYLDVQSWSNPDSDPATQIVSIYDSLGNLHAFDWDGSTIRLRADESDTYFISFHANSNFAGMDPPNEGGYSARVTIGTASSADLDGLLSGFAWDHLNLTYSFPTSPADYEYDVPEQFLGTSPAHQAAILTILEAVGGFCGLSFSSASTPASGDLRFAFADTEFSAYAYYPGPAEGGDSWYHYLNFNNQVPLGSTGHLTMMHEIGHALGLKHGHEAPAMSPEHNTHEFSIMTYRSWSGAPDVPFFNGSEEPGGEPQSFMMYDIAALQHLYGADFSMNGGDTTYRWDPNTGEMSLNGVGQGTPSLNRIFRTIWDGGGNDTYDLSNYANGVVIDLRPGEWTTASAAQLVNLHYTGDPTPPVYARGNIANALLYHGDFRSLIENAVGGVGDDRLIGNQGANTLDGRGGNDRLEGMEGTDTLLGLGGNDILNGGMGTDVMRGSTGDDTYIVDSRGDLAIENSVEGSDTVFSSVNFSLGSNVENLRLTGSAIRANGNSLGNRIVGNSAANIINGGVGADVMRGGGGSDTYYIDNASDRAIENAGEGSDTVYSSISIALSSNIENLTLTGSAIRGNGNNLANAITGNSGNNVINGGLGADTMRGGAGNDIYYVDNGGDQAIESSGAGTDRIYSTISLSLGSNVEQLFLRGSAALNATGNSLDNTLVGNSAANVLRGAGGADDLRGGGGADVFEFRDGDFGGLTPSTADRIIDFSRAQHDRIDLDLVDANTGFDGRQDFDFIGTGAFTGNAGELRYQQAGGNTYVTGDTNGDGIADFMIRLDGLHALSEGDFVI